jgi:hyaluronate lyase
MGMAAMDDVTDDGGFRARTSWFTIGDRVAVLVAGIRSDTSEPTETVICNHALNDGDGALVADGRPISLTDGTVRTIDVREWLHVEGFGAVLLSRGARLSVLRETRSGRWRDINKQGASPDDMRSRRYLTIWIDHGVRPSAASCGYLLLPAASRSQASSALKGFRVLENTAAVQAIAVAEGNEEITAAMLWERGRPGALAASDHPVLLMLRQRGRRRELAVCDPVQGSSGSITLTLPFEARATAHDPALDIRAVAGLTEVVLDRRDLRGRTLVASLES